MRKERERKRVVGEQSLGDDEEMSNEGDGGMEMASGNNIYFTCIYIVIYRM